MVLYCQLRVHGEHVVDTGQWCAQQLYTAIGVWWAQLILKARHFRVYSIIPRVREKARICAATHSVSPRHPLSRQVGTMPFRRQCVAIFLSPPIVEQIDRIYWELNKATGTIDE